ncbi:hypothetical protein F5Y16DRAFT_405789 [Xylariaceae sp. FL0255]|nr:hypothetical protein F5Y16DRAFT_405789 [Xylariaceae sp. FL0255]
MPIIRGAITLIKQNPTKSHAGHILQLRCHVRPGASKAREGIIGITSESIELCVSAPPQDGKANQAVLDVLSQVLDIPKSDLQITHGLKSKDKTVSITTTPLWHRHSLKDEELVELFTRKLLPTTS